MKKVKLKNKITKYQIKLNYIMCIMCNLANNNQLFFYTQKLNKSTNFKKIIVKMILLC